jgi:hypothetical protein
VRGGGGDFNVLYVYILIDVSKEEEIIVMRTTGAKGDFMTAILRRSVTRWQRSASHLPPGLCQWYVASVLMSTFSLLLNVLLTFASKTPVRT